MGLPLTMHVLLLSGDPRGVRLRFPFLLFVRTSLTFFAFLELRPDPGLASDPGAGVRLRFAFLLQGHGTFKPT